MTSCITFLDISPRVIVITKDGMQPVLLLAKELRKFLPLPTNFRQTGGDLRELIVVKFSEFFRNGHSQVFATPNSLAGISTPTRTARNGLLSSLAILKKY